MPDGSALPAVGKKPQNRTTEVVEMKKSIVLILVLTLAFFAASCDRPLDNDYPNDFITSDLNPDYPILSIRPDWPLYHTADEVVKAASNIYSGTVTGISFAVVDMKTGRVDENPKSASTARMLYTIYTVDVQESFKGDNPSETKICKTGGMKQDRVKEQYDLMERSGMLSRYNGIPICDEACSLAVGKTYLFCTSRTEGDFDHIINPTQFAYDPASGNAKNIVSSID